MKKEAEMLNIHFSTFHFTVLPFMCMLTAEETKSCTDVVKYGTTKNII